MPEPTREQLDGIGLLGCIRYLGRMVSFLTIKARRPDKPYLSEEDVRLVAEVCHDAKWDWASGKRIGFNATREEFDGLFDRFKPDLYGVDQKTILVKTLFTAANGVIRSIEAMLDEDLDETARRARILKYVDEAHKGVRLIEDDRIREASWDCINLIDYP